MSMEAIRSQAVQLDDVSVGYRGVPAVRNVSLDLPAGEILALLGPSGCGKTTLLRAIGGFLSHTGQISIGGHAMTRVPAHRRNIGMVFQDYALFPHMSVAENAGFGLRMRGVPREAITARVDDVLKLVGLEGFQARMARQLSGGQQQRVALARALVIKPRVLLLDEPLSALDMKLREEMRSELKRIQRVTGVTTVFVTHDQDEALALADRLALMNQGRLLQYGVPAAVYKSPMNSFVAQFLGAANSHSAVAREVGPDFILLEVPSVGILRGAPPPSGAVSIGDLGMIFVRPERIRVSTAKEGRSYSLVGVITSQTYLGRHVELGLKLTDGTDWTAYVGDEAVGAGLATGSPVSVEISQPDVFFFPQKEQSSLL